MARAGFVSSSPMGIFKAYDIRGVVPDELDTTLAKKIGNGFARLLKAKKLVDHATPMNLATTNDIIGGNSGSPLLNREGRVVGLVFDGNLPSLAGRYGYDPAVNRTVAVHGDAILTGLEKIYGASRVAKEIRDAAE